MVTQTGSAALSPDDVTGYNLTPSDVIALNVRQAFEHTSDRGV